MITIKVGNTPLYIPKDTTLVLEQHNNSFDIDNSTNDIIWTFDVPAAPNAVALNNAHCVNISNYKRYACTVSFNGIVISNGYLFVQSVVDERKMSCGVVLDGLGEDFIKRKLKDNDYGEDVTISQNTDNLETHRSNWISFLQGSLDADSIYKFFLFTCESFYKNNDAYGYHQNYRATLRADHDEKFWCNYINRLFFYYDTSQSVLGVQRVGNLPDTSQWGIKLFNTLGNNTDKLNGFAFAPAIRLDWLVKKVLSNAGYRVTGDFLEDSNVKKLYLQSMNAMDGDMTQFGLDEYIYLTNAEGRNDVAETENSFTVGVNEIMYNGFKLASNAPTFNFRLNADVDSLQHITPSNPFFQKEDEVFMLFVRPTNWNGSYPALRCVVNHSAAIKDYRYGTAQPSWLRLGQAAAAAGYNGFTGGSMATCVCLRMLDNGRFYGIDGFGNICQNADFFYGIEPNYAFIQLTTSYENAGANYEDPEHAVDLLGNFTANAFYTLAGGGSASYVVELVKMKVRCPAHYMYNGGSGTTDTSLNLKQTVDGGGGNIPAPIYIEYAGQLEWLEYMETVDARPIASTNTMLNVFETALRWRQHVPNVTNGDFLKKLCKFFGLSMYVNPFNKVVQLSFANNIFDAEAIDISDYVTSSERMTYEPTQYKISMATVLGTKGVAEGFMADDVNCKAELASARTKKRMSVFVKNENAYNVASLNDKTGKFEWETSAGNDRALVVGNDGGEVEEVSGEILVPNMRVVDTEGTSEYICDIATGGNSKLTDDDYTGEFDMILQQYKGTRYIGRVLNTGYFIEDANPTPMSETGIVNENFLNLSAVGKNAVGERWLRKLYEFKATQERYRFVAQLPVHVFIDLYKTQLPQFGKKSGEVRWIMVRNRKYMPLTISYEFGSKDKVLTTIECARMHY